MTQEALRLFIGRCLQHRSEPALDLAREGLRRYRKRAIVGGVR